MSIIFLATFLAASAVAFAAGFLTCATYYPHDPCLVLIKDWQPLIASFVAFCGFIIGWYSQGRQPRITLYGREEDRIEEVLPGLKAAESLLDILVVELGSLSKEDRALASDLLPTLLDQSNTEDIKTAVRRRLELTLRPLQMQIESLIEEIDLRARFIAHVYKKVIHWQGEWERNPTNDTTIVGKARVESQFDRVNDRFDAAFQQAEMLHNEIKQEIVKLESRRQRLRGVIDSYFD